MKLVDADVLEQVFLKQPVVDKSLAKRLIEQAPTVRRVFSVDSVVDFAELVGAMRDAQKEYFRTRDKAVLRKSKELEKKVDYAIMDLCRILVTPEVWEGITDEQLQLDIEGKADGKN